MFQVTTKALALTSSSKLCSVMLALLLDSLRLLVKAVLETPLQTPLARGAMMDLERCVLLTSPRVMERVKHAMDEVGYTSC
jgi:hypothetical protein